QRCNERQCLPGCERHAPDHPLASSTAATRARHVCVHRCFVDEDKTGRIENPLLAYPAPAGAGHIRTLLLARVQDFFECDAVALQKAEQRRAASRNPTLVHRRDNLVERPIALLLNQRDNLLGVILQWRPAPATAPGLKSHPLP